MAAWPCSVRISWLQSPRPHSACPTHCWESQLAKLPMAMEGQNPLFNPPGNFTPIKRWSPNLGVPLPASPGAVSCPQPRGNLTLSRLFTDILSRCTRCGCGYRLWDCLPHPPFCITLSPAVCKNQIMMVLWSQPAQPLHLPFTHALEDAVNVQSSQQTTHELLQSNICLIYFFAEVNYTEFFFYPFQSWYINGRMLLKENMSFHKLLLLAHVHLSAALILL